MAAGEVMIAVADYPGKGRRGQVGGNAEGKIEWGQIRSVRGWPQSENLPAKAPYTSEQIAAYGALAGRFVC